MERLPLFILWAAVSGLSVCAAADARARLRCWFYSALEYTQAFLLEKNARFPFSFPLSPAVWVDGYFPQDRRRLLLVQLIGFLLPVLSFAAWLVLGLSLALTAAVLPAALQLSCLLVQARSRVTGTDGKRHERFNRFAPLPAAARKRADKEAADTFITPLGRRFFPDRPEPGLSGENTVRDRELTGRLSRF